MDSKNIIIIGLLIVVVGLVAFASYEMGLAQGVNNTVVNETINDTSVNDTIDNSTNDNKDSNSKNTSSNDGKPHDGDTKVVNGETLVWDDDMNAWIHQNKDGSRSTGAPPYD